jgi:hypothetical protein
MILDNLLFGPAKLTSWLTNKLVEAAEEEMTDEAAVHQELLKLQMAYELEDLEEHEFLRREAELMQRLQEARDYKKRRGLE